MNLYAYVYNDPLNMVDPTGEWAHLVIGGGIGLVAGLVSEAIEVSIGGGEASWGGFIGAGLGGATTGTMMAACAGTCAAGAGAAGAALDSTLRQGINNTIDTGSLVEGVGSIDFNEVGTETVVEAAAGGLSKIPLANKIDDKLIDKVGLGGRGGPDHVARSQMTRMAHDVSDKVSVATAKKIVITQGLRTSDDVLATGITAASSGKISEQAPEASVRCALATKGCPN